MNKILLITDSANKNWNKVFYKQSSDDDFTLHSINTNTESVLQVIRKYPRYKNFQFIEMDTNKISQLAEKEARDYYLDLIRDLPYRKIFKGNSITDLLTINDRNYWWYLPLSEKNIWLDKSIHRFFEIKKLQHILKNDKYDKMICCLDDGILQLSFKQMAIKKKIPSIINIPNHKNIQWRSSALIFCFSYFINVFKTIISLYLKKIFVFNSKTKNNIDIADGTIGFFSFYPLFWKNIETDEPEDIFFNKISNEIENNNQVLHLIWLSPWKKLLANNDLLQRLQKNKKIYILEHTLKLKDAVSLFHLDIFKKLFFILFINKEVQLGTIGSINIKDIVYDEFFRSFSSPAFFLALLRDRALQKMQLEKCKLLFFRLEFQPHERAILYNTAGKVKSIGLQHSALSKNFLNYVFTKEELGKHWVKGTDVGSMPLPDHIFTSGQIGFDFMKSAGYPEDHLFISGGIRYHDLRKNVDSIPSKNRLRIQHNIPNKKKIIFVVTTPIIHETVGLLLSLYHAINNQKQDNSKFYVVVKHHPNTLHMQDYKNKTNEIIGHWRKIVDHEIIWNSINIHEYIKMSDVMLTSGGTLPLEAMIIGVPSIFYSTKLNFSHNPLENYSQSALFVNDTTSMASAIKKVIHNELKTELKKNWVKPVNDMFGVYTSNQSEKIIELINSL